MPRQSAITKKVLQNPEIAYRLLDELLIVQSKDKLKKGDHINPPTENKYQINWIVKNEDFLNDLAEIKLEIESKKKKNETYYKEISLLLEKLEGRHCEVDKKSRK